MEDDIVMANHAITNVADSQPHKSLNAANDNFVNRTVSDNSAFSSTLVDT